MMSNELATAKPSLLQRLSSAAGLDPAKFYAAVKTTCGCQGASDEHFAVLLMTADKYQLNPALRQLFLMPTKKGIEVVIPLDGWVPLLVNHPDYLAHEVVLHWDGKPYSTKVVAATCRIWTRSRNALNLGPFEHFEIMAECWRETGPWKSHPTRMLGHKAVIQAARRCFGIYVMDSDEAASIEEIRSEVKPVTLTFKPAAELPPDEPEIGETDEPAAAEHGGAYEGLRARIELCTEPQKLAMMALEIGEAFADGGLTQDEADELAAIVKG